MLFWTATHFGTCKSCRNTHQKTSEILLNLIFTHFDKAHKTLHGWDERKLYTLKFIKTALLTIKGKAIMNKELFVGNKAKLPQADSLNRDK